MPTVTGILYKNSNTDLLLRKFSAEHVCALVLPNSDLYS